MDSGLYRKSIVLTALWLSASAGFAQNWRDSLNAINKKIAATAWSTDLHLRKAAFNLELKQWQYAVDEYSLILQKERTNPAALFFRAYANGHLRRYELARKDYQDLLAIVPRHFEAGLSLAYVMQQQGKKTEALEQLNQVVEMHNDSAVAYVSRANLERELKLWDAALYDYQEASRLQPHDVNHVVAQVDLLLMLQRRKEARNILDDAVKRGIPRGLLQEWYRKIGR